ncbi:ANTAR domain-containing protein [Streptomyces cadmiisoli]|uniref:ANTAR domain-containing protein n=1 Tax=Streptomyces cadmiisoli TaxID=2184053 RepID=UPI003649E824
MCGTDQDTAGAVAVSSAAEAALYEREQLKQAMASRPVIDMAYGVLMATFGCPPQDSWGILRAVSQHAHVQLREVAEAVTAAPTGQPMPAHLQDHLTKAVARAT